MGRSGSLSDRVTPEQRVRGKRGPEPTNAVVTSYGFAE